MIDRAKIEDLKGPILIIGASGFIGANLLRRCLQTRSDTIGTFFSSNSWRLQGIPASKLTFLDIQQSASIKRVFEEVKPKTIFDCSSFGVYWPEKDVERIHRTNYLSFIQIMEEVSQLDLAAYIHAGTASEYGLNAAGPSETDVLIPNSHYAISKAAASQAIAYYGKSRGIPAVNLRVYSVYGPYEDSSRLIPVLCERGMQGQLPVFTKPEVNRDFIHVDDVVEAFIQTALKMSPEIAGESFNIGTGTPTSLFVIATLAKQLFHVTEEPRFGADLGRGHEPDHGYANPEKAKKILDWSAHIKLSDGLVTTRDWWRNYLVRNNFSELSKKPKHEGKNSVSIIITCYKDEQAIPILYERLISVLRRTVSDYEIIFVNDGSPDNSAEVIRKITENDSRVIGIMHSRNFGSQAAFRDGLEFASKEACILLDGDLQDPPELIEDFLREWRSGADVVYGRRVGREMPWLLEIFYHGFYQILCALSEIPIPKDAGEFSLMDRSVVYWILQCRERDAFLRGLRAYVGFKQVGVDYIRPKRPFGKSTHNWITNIGWAKKGIFSFTRVPLHLLTALGGIACLGTSILATIAVFLHYWAPEVELKGLTFVSLLVMFFGSSSILGIGLLGEYIGKIFEEVKERPSFIRSSLIIGGTVGPIKN